MRVDNGVVSNTPNFSKKEKKKTSNLHVGPTILVSISDKFMMFGPLIVKKSQLGLLELQPPPWSVFPRFPRARSTSDALSSTHYPTPRGPPRRESTISREPLHQEDLCTREGHMP